MTAEYSDDLENAPKRLRPAQFTSSIRVVPARNPRLEEFDKYVSSWLEPLGGNDNDNPTIGELLDLQESQVYDRSPPHEINLILLGYCYTHSWRIWATLEYDSNPAVLPLSVLEQPKFEFNNGFAAATYGALRFHIAYYDRLDISDHAQQRVYNIPSLNIERATRVIEDQSILFKDREAKTLSLRELVESRGLSNQLTLIDANLRRKVALNLNNTEPSGPVKGGHIEDVSISSDGLVIDADSEPRKSKVGRPKILGVVQEGFFQVLYNFDGEVKLSWRQMSLHIADALEKRTRDPEDASNDTASDRTARDHIVELKYFERRDDHPSGGFWRDDVWERPYAEWCLAATRKKLKKLGE